MQQCDFMKFKAIELLQNVSQEDVLMSRRNRDVLFEFDQFWNAIKSESSNSPDGFDRINWRV